jgi:two-component system, cell cycle response regulator
MPHLPVFGRSLRLPIPGTFLGWARRQYRCEPSEAWADWPASSSSLTPRYLIRPETPTARGFWLQVENSDAALHADMARVVRLRDVTAEMASRRDMRAFHHMLAHKLRTPLNQMLGTMTVLADESDVMSHEEIVSWARDGIAGVERLQREIENILQYLSAFDLGEVRTSFPLAAFPAVLDRIAREYGVPAITVLLQDDLEVAWISLSSQAVELVAGELIENAKKFHPTHTPTIEVRVSSPTPGQAHLQFRDDGLTLSPEQLAKVWTPYYQGEKYFTGEAQGMGLGLALVATLVWNVGGTCTLSNRADGSGVVVGLLVPLVKQP